jgi:hypothetical protein
MVFRDFAARQDASISPRTHKTTTGENSLMRLHHTQHSSGSFDCAVACAPTLLKMAKEERAHENKVRLFSVSLCLRGRCASARIFT